MFLIVLFVCTICYHRAVARTKFLHRVFLFLSCLLVFCGRVLFACLFVPVYIATRAELASLARALRSFRAGMVYVFLPLSTSQTRECRQQEQQNTRMHTTRTTKHQSTNKKNNSTREYRQEEQQNTRIQTTR